MTDFSEAYAKWTQFSDFNENQKISNEFARYLDELVDRLNFQRVQQVNNTNPNNVLVGDKGQLCQSSDGDLWIKTTDGGDNGWSKVGLQS